MDSNLKPKIVITGNKLEPKRDVTYELLLAMFNREIKEHKSEIWVVDCADRGLGIIYRIIEVLSPSMVLYKKEKMIRKKNGKEIRTNTFYFQRRGKIQGID